MIEQSAQPNPNPTIISTIDPQTAITLNSPPSQPEKKTNQRLLIIGLVGVTILALGLASFFYFQNTQLTEKADNNTAQLTDQITSEPTIGSTNQLTPTLSTATSAAITPTTKESGLTAVDATWNKYTNYELGFAIKIPKTAYFMYGGCELKHEAGGDSYRPKTSAVPVQIFANDTTFYIEPEYYYQLGGETKNDGISFYAKCDKTMNSVATLQNNNSQYKQGWTIVTKKVSNDQELEQFIKDNYGSGCKLGEKKAGQQAGTLTVSVDAGEFIDFDQAYQNGCLVNYMYTIRYNPSKTQVVSWKIGQSISFYNDETRDSYDTAMTESFEFLE